MFWITDIYEAISDFLYLGGPVLRWIAVTIFLMWVLIIERFIFFRKEMPPLMKSIRKK